jgi:hypothetical protein
MHRNGAQHTVKHLKSHYCFIGLIASKSGNNELKLLAWLFPTRRRSYSYRAKGSLPGPQADRTKHSKADMCGGHGDDFGKLELRRPLTRHLRICKAVQDHNLQARKR